MRILAIDSSGLVATVAVVEEENEISKTIAEYTINYKKTHSQTLLPMLDEIVKMTDMDLDKIDAIAVAGGPGSFTGLRIGSATAKGLGLALKKPLIHIPTSSAHDPPNQRSASRYKCRMAYPYSGQSRFHRR